jgi:cytochrome c-type biogenesis protein CcmH
VLLPAIAVGLYLRFGEPRGLDPAATQAAAKSEERFSDQQIVGMVETLAAKVRARPDDVQGWSLLARSMNALGRYPEAVDAYEHLAKLVPDNPDVLTDWADALAMKNGRNLKGKPYEMVKQALKIDPAHQKALALAGTAAMAEGDYATSLAHWQALGKLAPPGSEDQQKVAAIIEEVRGRAAAAGAALPPGRAVAQAPQTPSTSPSPKVPPPAPATPAAGASTVSGTVSVAPALAPQVAITDTLFIFARAEGGPRVPLAVLRGGARELPKDFVLDDSMAMAPGMKLSTSGPVRIEARVSKTGNATPQPGDLVGASGVVKPGARDVKIVIDRALP